MARAPQYHARLNSDGWPIFTSTQTENRIALCKKALCPDRTMLIRFKDCYQDERQIAKFCKLKFLSGEYFDQNLNDVSQLAWGGLYRNYRFALEGAFLPFVRCVRSVRPMDHGAIWIGTRHEYPRIFVNNLVAHWLCPYSRAGYVMVEPFEPLGRVLENWQRLADRRFYPGLNLPPVPDL